MRSIFLSVITLLIFSGCSTRTVYVKTPCPKLHEIHVEKPKGIGYEVR
jgi:uncharacterized protein YceK